ncbi:BCCT family transporter [Halegenticoccus soli]|uniref:BCCT family transporter n=1 Tax=Halegenticoccus soli TaxID=1985678 RepID=UPI000C6E949E
MSEDGGMVRRFVDELDPIVFGVGVAATLCAITAFVFRPASAAKRLNEVNAFIWSNFGWLYLLSMFGLVVFALFLVFGPWGNIKLGEPDEEPKFGFLEYFAMLYSAAIAAGIVFWGPAEAIFHYDTVPSLFDAQPQTTEAAIGAVQYTFFHWGISAWTGYVIMGIPIAFFAYRRGAPLRISTIILPLVGEDNLDGVWAKVIDILAVFATIGGIATTLGLVGNQFLTGIEYTTGISVGDLETILVITGLTIAFTVSVALGVEKGIRRISNFNMALFALVTVFVFVTGPTVYIMNIGTEAVGRYANQFITMSLYTGTTNGGEWVGAWTVFYWAWWFSWTPFVGLFIARVSRGRTVRQVVGTGVIASTGITIPWFATMGGTAIFLQKTGAANILGVVGQYGEAGSGYPLLGALPFGSIVTALFLLLVTTFFVTSADSSTLALGMLTTGGTEQPSTINRVVWGAIMGALASLLMVVGGVNALQAAAIITGGPFAVICLIAVAVMILEFRTIQAVFFSEERAVSQTDSMQGVPRAEDD